MRRAAQVAIGIVKWAALACAAFVAGVVVPNLFDEELSPNVAALAVRSDPVPERDNAYLALLGMDAPDGVDPIDEGLRQVAEHEVEIARPMADRRREFDKALAEGKFAARVSAPRFPTCEAPAIPCMRASLVREAALRAQLETSALQVERYLQALQLPAFDETATLDTLTFPSMW